MGSVLRQREFRPPDLTELGVVEAFHDDWSADVRVGNRAYPYLRLRQVGTPRRLAVGQTVRIGFNGIRDSGRRWMPQILPAAVGTARRPPEGGVPNPQVATSELWPTQRGALSGSWSTENGGPRPTLDLSNWSLAAGPFTGETPGASGYAPIDMVAFRRVENGVASDLLAVLTPWGSTDLRLTVRRIADGSETGFITFPGPWSLTTGHRQGSCLAYEASSQLLVVALPVTGGTRFYRISARDYLEVAPGVDLAWSSSEGWTVAAGLVIKSHWSGRDDETEVQDSHRVIAYEAMTMERAWDWTPPIVAEADTVLGSPGVEDWFPGHSLPYDASRGLLAVVTVLSRSDPVLSPHFGGQAAWFMQVTWLRAADGEEARSLVERWPAVDQTEFDGAAAAAVTSDSVIGPGFQGWGSHGMYSGPDEDPLPWPIPVHYHLLLGPVVEATCMDRDGNLLLAVHVPRSIVSTIQIQSLGLTTDSIFSPSIISTRRSYLFGYRPDGVRFLLHEFTEMMTYTGLTSNGTPSSMIRPTGMPRGFYLTVAGGRVHLLRYKPYGNPFEPDHKLVLEVKGLSESGTGSAVLDLGSSLSTPWFLLGGTDPADGKGWVFLPNSGNTAVMTYQSGTGLVSRSRATQDVAPNQARTALVYQGAVYYPWQDAEGWWWIARLA